jgi:hypothetical protein
MAAAVQDTRGDDLADLIDDAHQRFNMGAKVAIFGPPSTLEDD